MVKKAPEGPSAHQHPHDARSRGRRISILKKDRDIPDADVIESVEHLEKTRRSLLLRSANKSYLEAQYMSKIILHLLKLESSGKYPDLSLSGAHDRVVEALEKRSKAHDTKIQDKSVERLAVRLLGKLEDHYGRMHDFTPKEIDATTSDLYERLLEFENPVDEIRLSQKTAAFSQVKQDSLVLIPNKHQKHVTPENKQLVENFKHFIHDHEQKAVVEARYVAKIVALLDLAAEKGLYIALQGQKEFKEMQHILEQRSRHYSGEGRGALEELIALFHEIRRFVQIEPKKLAEHVKMDVEWLEDIETH